MCDSIIYLLQCYLIEKKKSQTYILLKNHVLSFNSSY